jgi:hypothetical protein
MLFDPARHELLRDEAWDEARARSALHAIVEDAEQALGSGVTWPTHPRDQKEPSSVAHKSLYLGSTGTLWAPASTLVSAIGEGRRAVTGEALQTIHGWTACLAT